MREPSRVSGNVISSESDLSRHQQLRNDSRLANILRTVSTSRIPGTGTTAQGFVGVVPSRWAAPTTASPIRKLARSPALFPSVGRATRSTTPARSTARSHSPLAATCSPTRARSMAAITFTGAKLTNKFRNSGTITGNLTLSGSDSTFTNLGSITGNVTQVNGTDTIANHGEIYGALALAGGDTVTNTGVIHGNVTLGNAGHDRQQPRPDHRSDHRLDEATLFESPAAISATRRSTSSSTGPVRPTTPSSSRPTTSAASPLSPEVDVAGRVRRGDPARRDGLHYARQRQTVEPRLRRFQVRVRLKTVKSLASNRRAPVTERLCGTQSSRVHGEPDGRLMGVGPLYFGGAHGAGFPGSRPGPEFSARLRPRSGHPSTRPAR